MKKLYGEFTKGIFKQNPIFGLMLGLCPTLAVSVSVENALGMGAAATFVLFFSNVIISLFRRYFPARIRIPCFIVVIATFVVIVEMVMGAYLPALSKSLGIFIPLIVVNCIILGRAEAFAYRNGFFSSILDALGMGLGFTLGLLMISFIREALGGGRILGLVIYPDYVPMAIATMAPGAFITIALLMGFFNILKKR
jgi:electron transport complex protein RnfE